MTGRLFAIGWVFWMCLLSVTSEGGRRWRRELRFPKGASVVAGIALASFLPKGPTDGLAHVLEFDLGFPFPDKFAIDRADTRLKSTHKKRKVKKPRARRNLKDQQKDIILKVETALNSLGWNGSSCMERFQCELRNISAESSLLEEFLSAVFLPSPEEECQQEFTCPVSFLQKSEAVLALRTGKSDGSTDLYHRIKGFGVPEPTPVYPNYLQQANCECDKAVTATMTGP